MIDIRRSEERGHANHGWLDSHHTFSFAGYHEPRHMGFRDLRVINEDRVQPGEGFSTHPHKDFEIISYVIDGALHHRDSMGHESILKRGQVQRISAGTGISHSEYNASDTELVHFLQIWIQPSVRGVVPNYAHESFSDAPDNALTLVCSAQGRAGTIPINQNVDLFIGRLAASQSMTHDQKRGYAWIQLIEGAVTVNGVDLSPGDGLAWSATAADGPDTRNTLDFATRERAHFLLFDLH